MLLGITCNIFSYPKSHSFRLLLPSFLELQDTTVSDTSIQLIYPIQDHSGNPFEAKYSNPFDLNDPSNIQKNVGYDAENKQYIISQSIGDKFYRNPTYLSFEEYLEHEAKQSRQEYWKKRTQADEIIERSSIIPQLQVKSEIFDRIFGGSTVDIRPRGSAELTFAGDWNRNDDPSLPDKSKKNGGFKFDMKIQMNLLGQIGEKLKITANYNTEAQFDFENQMRLEYTGYEDEIIKKIEIGNVSLPLSGTLITGSQSLFGIKTQLQFGRLMVTNVLSQQKTETSTIQVESGAQTSTFEVRADNYESNKNYFLSQYFRDNFDTALSKLPVINSPIIINKIEVWVTNERSETENVRDIIAFMDLGEFTPYSSYISGTPGKIIPETKSNNLIENIEAVNKNVRYTYQAHNILSTVDPNFIEAQDFIVVETARKLTEREFYLQPQLGYISLNYSLNSDEVLSVAYQYTYNGVVYQVGEFSQDIPPDPTQPNVLYTKMLKSTTTRTNLPLWNLMMKNIYSIGAYNLQNKNFKLDVIYEDDITGANMPYIPADILTGIPLINILNLDNLNSQLDPYPDGIYDFIDGVTIHSANGRIVFPVLEPFGNNLRSKFSKNDVADKYVFDALYDSTKSIAQQEAEFNKFIFKGIYQSSSSSEISLGAMNVPEGSVIVSANGTKLVENQDYSVDYLLGRVKIINDGILQSGAKIDIKFDNNTLFAIKQKTLTATRLDYRIAENFNIGGTILKLSEKPLTPKIDMGNEPISNTIWGLDGAYHTESGFLTALVDKIPLIDTKTPSDINVTAEFAQLRPGHHKDIEQGKEPVSYIDDFESSKSPIDLKSPFSWVHSSTPQMFSEATFTNNLAYGFNRAKLAWYTVDPLFHRNNNLTPDHIKNSAEQSNHFVREVLETEIFTFKQRQSGQNIALPLMNLVFYPKERGPYNYDVLNIDSDGFLKYPTTRWSGIMRELQTTDFEAANVDYIEFWLMDPFVYDQSASGGDLYVNLGNISEDVLKDSRKAFENGLPKTALVTYVDTTIWGRVPTLQAITPSFDTDPNSRLFQDVGLDGFGNNDELSFFKSNIIDSIGLLQGTSSLAFQKINEDPSSDNYHYFRGNDYDNQKVGILNRYKYYNGLEANSPTSDQSTALGVDYPTAYTTRPNAEDINKDNTLNKLEEYFQYKIQLKPSKMQKVGENYITDIVEKAITNSFTGNLEYVKWYQFKIPVNTPDEVVGNIQDFKSIRFIRIFCTNFQDTVVIRFAKLQLVRSEWRKYNFPLSSRAEIQTDDKLSETIFDVSTVNIEENGGRQPINYVLPPEIERERNILDPGQSQLNEQSLSLITCNLLDGEARAVYKNITLDLRTYKRIKMFIHAEGSQLNKGDITAFIRLGTDFNSNFYEYEIPLTPTAYGATAAEAIWPVENELDVALEEFQLVKIKRDSELKKGTGVTLLNQFPDPDNPSVSIVGIPDLSSVRTIMIGIRNPSSISNGDDDGLPKCAEVWVNELRLSEFDEKGGWAAKAMVQTKLADLATVTLSGSKMGFGFGGIEQAITQRSKENVTQYDVSSNVQLGKFFPEKSGVKIPAYVGYSKLTSKPQYDPFNPDILFQTKLDALKEDPDFRDSIKDISQTLTSRKSINFTNIQVAKTLGKKNRFYDPQNLTFSVAYNQILNTSPVVEGDTMNTYKAAMAYNFNSNPKNYTPFKNIDKPRPKKPKEIEKEKAKQEEQKKLNQQKSDKAQENESKKKDAEKKKKVKDKNKDKKTQQRKSNYLRIIKDFNFYAVPKTLAFRTDLDRRYGIKQMRNVSGYDIDIDPTFDKAFTWNRHYTLMYDITKSLKVDFSANNQARVDEPQGRIDTQEKEDSIINEIKALGRTVTYQHTSNISYTVPINKIPLTDWITVNGKFTSTYDWTAAPLGITYLGNTIANSRSSQLNSQFKMTTLYNKIPYFKRVNTKSKTSPKKPLDKPKDKSSKKDTTETQEDKTGVPVSEIIGNFAKFIMMLDNFSLNYSITDGTLLPGYMQKTEYVGQDWNKKAPGLDFLFVGYQPDKNWLYDKAEKEWLTTDTTLNKPLIQNHTENISGKATLYPLNDLSVDLNTTYTRSKSNQEFFRNVNSDYNNPVFVSLSPKESGSYSISFITWKTAFQSEEQATETFTQFENNRLVVAERLAIQNPNWSGLTDSVGFPAGYSRTNQDVLIPAFLAAYSDKNPASSTFSLSPFPKMPKPNWRVTYRGLTKIAWINKYFSTVNLSHAYRSTYSVNNYSTVLTYAENDGFPVALGPTGDFIPKYEISQISISEQFAPLLNLDMQWRNSLTTKFELKKNRTLSMSFSNSQLSQVDDFDAVFGIGYKFKEFLVPFKIKGEQKRLKNDLNCKLDLSFRNSRTLIRKLDQDIAEPTRGTKTILIKVSVDYVVNERLNVRAFYERRINTPVVSTSYPTANTKAGISIKFTLSG